MHWTVLVKVELIGCEDMSLRRRREYAIGCAYDELEPLVGHEIDYCDSDEEDLKMFLTKKSGKTVQACRASEFDKFTRYQPNALFFDRFIESDFMKKYSVEWGQVLNTEIQEAVAADKKANQIWLVAMDVHI